MCPTLSHLKNVVKLVDYSFSSLSYEALQNFCSCENKNVIVYTYILWMSSRIKFMSNFKNRIAGLMKYLHGINATWMHLLAPNHTYKIFWSISSSLEWDFLSCFCGIYWPCNQLEVFDELGALILRIVANTFCKNDIGTKLTVLKTKKL